MEIRHFLEVNAKFQQLISEYIALEKKQHFIKEYPTLTFSEVHTVVLIGKYESINLTRLSEIQEVSRSAVTQMVSRLVQKDLVIKTKTSQGRIEYILSLTNGGRYVCQQHQKQHDYLIQSMMNVLKKYPSSFINDVQDFMEDVMKVWLNLPWDSVK